jgi:hypothetical protein
MRWLLPVLICAATQAFAREPFVIHAEPATVGEAAVGALLGGCVAHATGQITIDSDVPLDVTATPVRLAPLSDWPKWIQRDDAMLGKPTLAKLNSGQGPVWVVAYPIDRHCTVFAENDDAGTVQQAVLAHVEGKGVPWVREATSNGLTSVTRQYRWKHSEELSFILLVTAPDDPRAVTVASIYATNGN